MVRSAPVQVHPAVVQVVVQAGSVFGLAATNFDVGWRQSGTLKVEPRAEQKGRASSPIYPPSFEKLNHPEPDLNQRRELRR